jgi:tetratricopeptide (TPR) repeat protein
VKKYDKSAKLYQYFMENWPKNEQALGAQKGLVFSQINLGDEESAQAAIDKLLADFSGHKHIAKTVYDIGLHYRSVNKADKALKLHKHNTENSPKDDKYTMWSQMEIIKYHVRDGNEPAVDAAYEKLINEFSDQPTLATEICRVGDMYIAAGNYEKAGQLYQYVFDHWPGNERLLLIKAGTVKLDIAHGDEPTIKKTIDNLISDFNDHPELPRAIFQIGEQYWRQAMSERANGLEDKANEYFRKALAVWERVIKELPPCSTTAETYYLAASCYRRLQEYEKAIEYYQKIVDSWPNFGLAWSAQFRIGECYERLTRENSNETPETDVRVIAAYERLLQVYPDCPAANAARDRLKHNVRTIQGGQK